MNVQQTKLQAAIVIYENIMKNADENTKVRREFMWKAQEEVGLTKNGASTYFQNIKKKFAQAVAQKQERWLVVDRNRVEVAQFASRAQARDYAKERDLKVQDRNK